MKPIVLLAYLLAGGWSAFAQAPTVDKTALTFTYLFNSGAYPKAQTLKATLPSTVPSTTVMAVDVWSSPSGWLTVSPAGPSAGVSPLNMSVTVNPTSLAAGSYPGTITIRYGTVQTVVKVTLAVTNPPSSLMLSSTSFPTSGSTTYALSFDYTSGGTLPTADVFVSTTGDIIPFTVTTAVGKAGSGTAANWLRVNNLSNISLPSTTTSGVSAAGSNVKIQVSLDQASLDTLDAIPYSATITIAPVNSATTTSYTVSVTLNVSAGAPVLCLPLATTPGCAGVSTPIFPSSLPVFPQTSSVTPIPPVITLYGDNFFLNSSYVFAQIGDGSFIPLTDKTWVSRKIMTATIPIMRLTPPQANPAGETWAIVVVNGAAGATPSNASATSAAAAFTLTDPTQPSIQSVVNAASYLPRATQLGTGPDPAPAPNSAVSPREIISIFGSNLGPTSICSNAPDAQSVYQPTIAACPTVGVTFDSLPAPLIMVSANQINAIVPDGLKDYPEGSSVTITVTVGSATPANFPARVVKFDPGLFTLGGNGQGQAAVLNFDSKSGVVTVNGKSASATRGGAVEIFATGFGDLLPSSTPTCPDSPLADGQVFSGACKLAEDSYRVLIGGQSAAIFYAGTAGNGVAGLVQINAIVPPNSTTGAAVPITVEIGPVTAPTASNPTGVTARRSQAGVTIAVK
jgi:uncharacterized protein (TIGR03437 family)